MNIALFLTYDYSLKTWSDSGTLERELKVFKALEKDKNVNFTIFSYGNKDEFKYEEKLGSIRVVPIQEKIRLPKQKILRYIVSFKIPFKLRKELANIDLIQQNQLLGTWVSLLTSFIYKKPFYLRTGYDMYQFSIHENKKLYIRTLYKVLTFLAIKYSNLYTVTSSKDYQFLKNNFKSFKNVVIRPNWVSSTENIQSIRYPDRILCVGRLTYQKNLYFLIEEMSKVDFDLTLDFVGSGEELENLQQFANTKKLSVNFLNSLPHKDLMDLYQNYKYFISSSLYEGHPKTILEAMASGCVVFASKIPGHTEIIKHLESGIIFDLKKDSLKNCFEKYFNQDSLNKKISKNSKNFVENNFSLSKLVDDTFVDYSKLKDISSR